MNSLCLSTSLLNLTQGSTAMRPLTLFFLCVYCAFVSMSNIRAQEKDPLEIPGKIRNVTLYRERALVTRDVSVPAGAAFQRVLVTGLPQNFLVESVYAEAGEGAIVRALQVRSQPVAQLPLEQQQAIAEEKARLTQQQKEIEHTLEMISKDTETLAEMIKFGAVAGSKDLTHGVLDAEALTNLTKFSMTQRRELDTEQYQSQLKLQDLAAQLKKLTKKRSAKEDDVKPSQQAVFVVELVEKALEQGATVRLKYLVQGCGWEPQYTVRGNSERNQIDVRYSAVVYQGSGEPWNDVRLVLSTLSPSASAARPLLTAFEVTTQSGQSGTEKSPTGKDPFAKVRKGQASNNESLEEMTGKLRLQQREAEAHVSTQGFGGFGGFGDSSERRDLALNAVAGQLQKIELHADAQSRRNLAPDAYNDVATQQYELPRSVTLDSRLGQETNTVDIREFTLDAESYHVATPLLSSYAYREVQVTNNQTFGLLSGPATVYLDDRYVGRVSIPSTASGQLLTIGMGPDIQVRTRRELLDKQEIVKGGNRQVVFNYRLVLANFKQGAVSIRLMDRVPFAQQSQELSVKLADPKLELSDDGLYQRVERPTGVLRWDLTIPADRHGSKAFDVDYSYTMEFDRSRTPATVLTQSELQAQYRNTLMPQGGGGFGGGGFGGGGGGGFGGGGGK
jgi:hypothetical protein